MNSPLAVSFGIISVAKIYIAEDPNGRTVELAAAAFAFAGKASDVLISDLLD